MLYIEPPEPAIDSDQDSGDEEGGGFINNLTGRQLNAGCEVVLASTSQSPRQSRSTSRGNARVVPDIQPEAGSSRTLPRGLRASRGRSSSRRGRGSRSLGEGRKSLTRPDQFDNSSSNSDDSEAGEPPSKKSKKNNASRRWIDEDLVREPPMFPEANFSSLRGKSPTEILDLFLGESVYNLLVDQSQKYAAFLNCTDPKISTEEVKAFIAILILFLTNPVANVLWRCARVRQDCNAANVT